jgi:hypothetical protein
MPHDKNCPESSAAKKPAGAIFIRILASLLRQQAQRALRHRILGLDELRVTAKLFRADISETISVLKSTA